MEEHRHLVVAVDHAGHHSRQHTGSDNLKTSSGDRRPTDLVEDTIRGRLVVGFTGHQEAE